MPTDTTDRIYAGRTRDQRRSDRRARLLSAGLQVFGTEGYPAGTADRLCREAGVSPRHFYEHFVSRDEVLATLFDQVMTEVGEAVLVALRDAPPTLEGRAGAAIDAFLTAYLDDPRRAAIACIEVTGSDGMLAAPRRRSREAFADVIASEAIRLGVSSDARLTGLIALALVGAVNEVTFDWVFSAAETRPSRQDIAFALTQLFVAAATIHPPDRPALP